MYNTTMKECIFPSSFFSFIKCVRVGVSYVRVGDGITLADVAVVGSLAGLLRLVMGAKARDAYPNVARWYVDCVTHNNGAFALLGGADKAALMCSADGDSWEAGDEEGGGGFPSRATCRRALSPVSF